MMPCARCGMPESAYWHDGRLELPNSPAIRTRAHDYEPAEME